MFDPVTLDQLRALVAVVEEGSFSAAARKLRRVQSAVSTAMANLENQLGLALWDRGTKIYRLTEQGEAVVAQARRILQEVDALRRLTSGMVLGLEPTVSLCVDALFPVAALVDLCVEFSREFPAVDLRVDTQVMSGVSERVLKGSASIGVAGPHGIAKGLERTALAPIRMVPVVGALHPLAKVRGPISSARLRDTVQIVLSERSEAKAADQGVLSPRTFRVADLHTKHAMLRENLGWGNLPEHLVREELASGKLKRIVPVEWGEFEHELSLWAIYRGDISFGPAHRWLLSRLQSLCVREGGAAPASSARRRLPRGGKGRRLSA
jgi:DNA-binding transcriptional LysR family regulator